MKINVCYTDEMIRELIAVDMRTKLADIHEVSSKDITVKVRSKQNYREKEWEIGELKCELEVDI